MFSYKESIGTNDTIIGKPLEYKEFGLIADIVFSNNFEDAITYNSTNTILGYKYAHHYNIDSTAAVTVSPKDKLISNYNNGWNATTVFSKQRVVDQFIPPVDGTQNYTLSVTPLTNSPADVIVTVDGVKAKQSITGTPYDYQIIGNALTFTTNKLLKADQVIEVKSYTKDSVNLNDNHYFEIPDNFEANPNSLDVVSASASELGEHFRTIIDNQESLVGDSKGINNYRDTVQDRSKGTRILQHDSTLLSLMFLLSYKDIFSITESIRHSQNEYSSFKIRVLQQAVHLSTLIIYDNISEFLDKILEELYLRRNNLKCFANYL